MPCVLVLCSNPRKNPLTKCHRKIAHEHESPGDYGNTFYCTTMLTTNPSITIVPEVYKSCSHLPTTRSTWMPCAIATRYNLPYITHSKCQNENNSYLSTPGKQFDVKTVFLNSPIQEEVYMKAPYGFHWYKRREMLHLLKAIHGTCQVGHRFDRWLKSVLLSS